MTFLVVRSNFFEWGDEIEVAHFIYLFVIFTNLNSHTVTVNYGFYSPPSNFSRHAHLRDRTKLLLVV